MALLVLVGFGVLGAGVSDRLRAGGSEDPTAESTVAGAVLDERFPASRPNLALLVGPTDPNADVDTPGVATAGEQLAGRLRNEDGVVGVTSYWQTRAGSLRARDGRHALIVARVQGNDTEVAETLDRVQPLLEGRHGPITVSFGGATAIQREVRTTIGEDLVRAEIVALPITLILLVLVFGSAVAALLPLMIGIVSILGTNAVLRVLSGVTDVSIFALNLTTALGLGLAIDYALLIVRRYREELRSGLEPRAAVVATLRTAGKTVLFSALIVAVSLAAMMVFPLYFLKSFAYSGISVVLIAAAAALTVLPAVLVLLGRRVNAWDVRRLVRRRSRAAASADRAEGWARLADTVTARRRAPFFLITSLAVLVLVGLPFLQVQFGSVDDRQLPEDAPAHQTQQVIRETFGSRPTGVVTVLMEGIPDPATSPEPVARYAQRLSALSGVGGVESPAGSFVGGRRVAAPTPADRARYDGGIGYVSVLPTVEDISRDSEELVRQVRAVDAPFSTGVTGQAAEVVDTQTAIGSRLGLAGALIAAVTIMLIFLLTGSLLLPFVVVVLSILSLSAMFGAVVWVFQDGNLSGLLGFTPTGFIDPTLPVLMFCVAFGLSMDYGVFLLSRIKEEYDRGGDVRRAVSHGMARTGGVITAAALTLSAVLIAVGTSRVTNIKMMGLGAALAVIVDATIVRCVTLPAAMGVLGRSTWWAPAFLLRFQRRFGIREDDGPARDPDRSGPAGPPAGGDQASGEPEESTEPAGRPAGVASTGVAPRAAENPA
ncbi:MAG TPA: MMPL family transporter [Mycobacteriales bacterium]